MERAIRASVLVRKPKGRDQIESILWSVYRLNTRGFWRWLYHQGELDSPNPPEDLDPVIKLMDHASINHRGVQKQECKICAVWMILWDCWRVAENSGNALIELVKHFEWLLQELVVADKKLFGKKRSFLRAVESLCQKQEVRRSDGKTAYIRDLNEIIIPQNPKQRKDEIIGCDNSVSISIRRLLKDVRALLKSVDDVLRSPMVVYVHPNDKRFLVSKVAYDLREAGFKPKEITDMLNGEEPLTHDRGSKGPIMSDESGRKVESIVRRIRRFSKNVEKQNQDVDKSY